MFKIAALIVTLAVTSAQEKPSPISAGELARELAFYKTVARLEASFTQTKRLKDLEMNLKSRGTLKFFPPDRVEWLIFSPSRVKVVFDREEMRVESGAAGVAN